MVIEGAGSDAPAPQPVTDDIGDWAQVPGWVIDRCANLTPICLNTYTLLALYRNWRTGEAWPSLSVLAGRLGCSESVARRALHSLRDEGLIRIVPRRDDNGRQTTNHYWLARVPFQLREGALPLTPGPEMGTESDTTGKSGSRGREGGGSRGRHPNEREIEQDNPSPAASVGRRKQRTPEGEARETAARDLTQRYWDWYRLTFSAEPPETFMAIKALIEWGLKDFTGPQVRQALKDLDANGRPLTRQTLQEAMLNARRTAPRGRAGGDDADRAREDQEAEIARRELEDANDAEAAGD
jgi:DNA-binding transcriptional MocR family regulator